jgi:dihydrofolate reductase
MSSTRPSGRFLTESQRRKNDFEEVTMRKVVAAEFVSLDGVFEAPDQWHFPYFDDEMGQEIGRAMAASDAILMGRVLYEEWADFWPRQDPEENPVAARMNGVRKYVVSTTLKEPLGWDNSTLVKENVAEEIAGLKRQTGGDISISGSSSLVRSLLQYGLIDELRLMIHPVVVGRGKRLFEEGGERIALELVDSKTFSTGVVGLLLDSLLFGARLLIYHFRGLLDGGSFDLLHLLAARPSRSKTDQE